MHLGLREEKAVEHCLECTARVFNTNSMFPDILLQRSAISSGSLLEGALSSPLGAPYGSWWGAPATRGCPGVAQVANKAAGSSLKALGVTFGPHLPASALSGVSGQQAWHLRARARALHF